MRRESNNWIRFGKKSCSGFLAVFMILSLVNVPAGSVEAASKKKITMSKTSATLVVGKKLKLKAKVKDSSLKKKQVVWKSGKKAVATVNTKGVVTAKKKGKAKITATIKGTKYKATCVVTVVNQDATTAEVTTEATTSSAATTEVVKEEPQKPADNNTNNVPNKDDTKKDDGETETPSKGDDKSDTSEDVNEQERIKLAYVLDENNPTYMSMESDSENYVNGTVYKLLGYQTALGKVSKPQVVLEDTEKTEIVSVEPYSAEFRGENAPEIWSYVVKAKYKESSALQEIYLQYEQQDICSFISYIKGSSTLDKNQFIGMTTYVNDNAQECIRVYDNKSGFDSWDKVRASGRLDTYPKYSLEIDADKHELVIGVCGDTQYESERFDEIGRYPLEIGYYPVITKVIDGDNYTALMPFYGRGTVGNVAYAVVGEEDQLGMNAQFITEDESVGEIKYVPYEEMSESDYIYCDGEKCRLAGEVQITFLNTNQTSITERYGIYYMTREHTVGLKGINQANNTMVDISRISYDSIKDSDIQCDGYCVMGTADELVCGDDCKEYYQFDVENNIESVSVQKMEPETSRYDNYLMTLSYRGKPQYIIIHYVSLQEKDLLPSNSDLRYDTGWWAQKTDYTYKNENEQEKKEEFSDIRFENIDGRKVVAMITKGDREVSKVNLGYKGWTIGREGNEIYYISRGYIVYNIVQNEENVSVLQIGVHDGYEPESGKIDRVIATYPLVVKYVPEITLVKPENNIVVDTSIASDNDGLVWYEIYAENETPNSDWQFEVPDGYDVSYNSKTEDMTGSIGTITITEATDSTRVIATYPVRYKKKNHALEPEYIEFKDNVVFCLDEVSDKYYEVRGYGDEPGDVVKMVCDSDIDSVDGIKKVEDQDWNYEITVTYKGEPQVIKIQYKSRKGWLPEKASYQDEFHTEFPLDVQMTKNEDGDVTDYKLIIDHKKFPYWDKIKFMNAWPYGVTNDCTFCMKQQSSGEYALIISQGDQQVVVPTTVQYVPRILSLTEKNNYFDVERRICYTDDDQQYYYKLNGEEATLGKNEIAIETTDSEATAIYRPYENGEGIDIDGTAAVGEIVLSYQDEKQEKMTRRYPVIYTNGLETHRVQLVKIADSDNTIIVLDKKIPDTSSDYGYDEYTVCGLGETLSNDAYVFDVPADCVKYSVDTSDTNYQYILDITYKGQSQKIKIKYEQITETDMIAQINCAGTYYTTTDLDKKYRFAYVDLVTEQSQKYVLFKTFRNENKSEIKISLTDAAYYIEYCELNADASQITVMTPTGIKFEYPIMIDTTEYNTVYTADTLNISYALNELKGISDNQEYLFIPKETGKYKFYTEYVSGGQMDYRSIVFLSDMDNNSLGSTYNQDVLEYELQAGKVYYISTRSKNRWHMEYKLHIELENE